MSNELSYRIAMFAMMVGYVVGTVSSALGFSSLWGVGLLLAGGMAARAIVRFVWSRMPDYWADEQEEET